MENSDNIGITVRLSSFFFPLLPLCCFLLFGVPRTKLTGSDVGRFLNRPGRIGNPAHNSFPLPPSFSYPTSTAGYEGGGALVRPIFKRRFSLFFFLSGLRTRRRVDADKKTGPPRRCCLFFFLSFVSRLGDATERCRGGHRAMTIGASISLSPLSLPLLSRGQAMEMKIIAERFQQRARGSFIFLLFGG